VVEIVIRRHGVRDGRGAAACLHVVEVVVKRADANHVGVEEIGVQDESPVYEVVAGHVTRRCEEDVALGRLVHNGYARVDIYREYFEIEDKLTE
jgi:hypothetical protein